MRHRFFVVYIDNSKLNSSDRDFVNFTVHFFPNPKLWCIFLWNNNRSMSFRIFRQCALHKSKVFFQKKKIIRQLTKEHEIKQLTLNTSFPYSFFSEDKLYSEEHNVERSGVQFIWVVHL